VTAPAVVQNLTAVSVDTSTIRLTWTAPGDDGTSGTPSVYDLRHYQSATTAWDQMTLVSGEPAPGASGQAQTLTVAGLSAGTTYYFRLKAADEVPNWSATSNLASATTASRPVVPFALVGTFATDLYPLDVATGDLNADGRVDIVTANQYSFATAGFGSTSVLLGAGDGTFGAHDDYWTQTNPMGIAIAEVSGDGIPDVIVPAHANPSYVSLLYGNGDGTLQAKLDWACEDRPEGVAVGDFDRDGKLDLATGNDGAVPPGDPYTVTVLLAYWNPKVLYTTGRQPLDIATWDLNGDGALDLVTVGWVPWESSATFGSASSILLGHGNGTFAAPTSIPLADRPAALKLVDLNGDGALDVVSSCTISRSVSVLLGNGDGTFGNHTEFSIREGGGSLAVADFNRDGLIDVAVAVGDWVSVLPGRGDGTFTSPIEVPAPASRGIATGDFNGDGWPDFATARYFAHEVAVFLNTGQW
jgi:hypothetical protein